MALAFALALTGTACDVGAGRETGGRQTDPPATEPARPPTALNVVQALVETFNRHDAAALAAAVTEDFIWFGVSGDEITVEVRGAVELERAMAQYFSQTRDVRSTIEDAVVQGRFVSIREQVQWQGADGVRSQSALGVYEVVDGRIRRIWYYPADSAQ